MLCTVITKDRTMLIEDSLTLRQVAEVVHKRGSTLNIRKTFQYYGLQYLNDSSFTYRYAKVFNLTEIKTLKDIKLHELSVYRETLVGYRLPGV